MERIDPADITGINEHLRSWAAPGEFIRPVAIEKLVIADDALDALVETVEEQAAGGKVLMVCDHTPMRRGGDDVKTLVFERLARRVAVQLRQVPIEPDPCHAKGGKGVGFLLAERPGGCCAQNEPDPLFPPCHAKLEAAKELQAELGAYAAVVSVGSGSITDLAKYARHLFVEANPGSRQRFISFPTAASVTAFTSALAVLSVDGVKRTLSSRGPDAVICDLRTIADAPPAMVQAGFGDVMARSVAYGDYYLAHVVGMDDDFSVLPGKLLAWGEQDMIERADQVAAAALPGVRSVTEAVLLAGMAMSIVNQTAPISGWEHVISHFFDMTADHDRREQALHGGQVGVATLVAARAYERAWANLDLDRITAEVPAGASAAWRKRIEATFAPYDPQGGLTAEVWRDYDKKMTRWARSLEARTRFAARKRAGEFEDFMKANVRPSSAVDTALARAGAPRTFADLDKPISRQTAHHALQFSHLIRARFTLGDLLDQGGWLNPKTAEELL